MQQLRRVVQFCLGVQAFGLVATVPMVVAMFTSLAGTDGDAPNALMYAFILAVSMVVLLMNLVPAIAWWCLKKGKPVARVWTIGASMVNLFILLIGILVWSQLGRTPWFWVNPLSGLVGVLGLIAFWREEAPAEVKAHRTVRISGDGTSPAKDHLSQALSVGMLWISFHYWRLWSDAHALKQPGLLEGVILFQCAILLNTLIHELGHFAAGWASRMTLRRFQVGPFQWAIRNGQWNFQFRLNQFYGGGVGMVAPTLYNIRGREAFMIMGGPAASLAVGAIATTAALAAKGHAWEPYWAFLSMCGAMGWALFITNLIPLKSAARYSDGAQLYQLVTGGEWAHFHIAFAMVASSLVTSIRPRDFHVATIRRAADFVTQGEQALLLRLFACLHYLDTDRVPEALASMEAAETLYDQSAFEKPEDICAEFVFINAFHKRDLAAAELWWQRIESLDNIDRDADYWRARTALLWLKGKRAEAAEAWERGNVLAEQLPAAGVYEGTRACFAKLRAALEAPLPLRSLQALAAFTRAEAESIPAVAAQ